MRGNGEVRVSTTMGNGADRHAELDPLGDKLKLTGSKTNANNCDLSHRCIASCLFNCGICRRQRLFVGWRASALSCTMSSRPPRRWTKEAAPDPDRRGPTTEALKWKPLPQTSLRSGPRYGLPASVFMPISDRRSAQCASHVRFAHSLGHFLRRYRSHLKRPQWTPPLELTPI